MDCHFAYPGGPQALLQAAIDEISSHETFYGSFLSPGWRNQLEEYKNNKKYDSNVVDLLIPALCNLTQTSCQIITQNANGFEEGVASSPARLMKPPDRDIVLCRVGSHYDAAVCSSPEDDTGLEANTEIWENVPKKSLYEVSQYA